MTEPFLGIDWKAFSVLAGMMIAWTMLLIKIIAWLLKRSLGAFEDKVESLQNEVDKEAEHRRQAVDAVTKKYDKLDGDFRHFLADLPKQYVAREDWLRTWFAVDVKMDRINDFLLTLTKGRKQ